MPHSFTDSYSNRFSGIGRLYSETGLERLLAAHVCVIGIGGVGTWAAEALARSGIGEISLVDMDDICISNTNRQLHALEGQIGKQKVDAIADRILAINPECKVNRIHSFFMEKTADDILSQNFTYIIDAIDSVKHKCYLLAECKQRAIPVITTGGAGGRRDPSKIQYADLARTRDDPLLAKVRRILRKEYGFTKSEKKKFKIDCVYSTELTLFPWSDGTVCEKREAGSTLKLDCESGYGSATFLTGTFGFMAAAKVVEKIAAG